MYNNSKYEYSVIPSSDWIFEPVQAIPHIPGEEFFSSVFFIHDNLIFYLRFDFSYELIKDTIYCFDSAKNQHLPEIRIGSEGDYSFSDFTDDPEQNFSTEVIRFLGVIGNDLIIHIAPYRIVSVNTLSGKLNWVSQNYRDNHKGSKWFKRELYLDKDNVHFLDSTSLFQFNLKTLKWSQIPLIKKEDDSWTFFHTRFLNGLIYFTGRKDFGTSPNAIGILNPLTGEMLWSFVFTFKNGERITSEVCFYKNKIGVFDSAQLCHVFESAE